MLLRCLAILAMMLLFAMSPRIASATDEIDPYVAAANEAGVPLGVLVAIVGAESGYHPWALDIFCRSRAEAEAVLAGITTTNVDIGLMQINWRFWGPRLGIAKSRLLDPRINLLTGARILRDGLNRNGSIWRRISNYHSGDTRERERYNRQVYDAYVRYMRGDLR